MDRRGDLLIFVIVYLRKFMVSRNQNIAIDHVAPHELVNESWITFFEVGDGACLSQLKI